MFSQLKASFSCRNFKYYLYFLSLSVVVNVQAQITWEQPVAANIGYVESLTINKNGYLFAGTLYNGVYRSKDNGNTWESLPIFASNICASISDSSGNVFLGTWGQGVYKSTDNGNTWVIINYGLYSLYIRSLAISPNGCIFAGTNNGNVYRSNDDGGNWSLIFSNYTNDYIRHIAINSAGKIFVSTADRGIYRSDDNGINWTPINNGLGTTSISFVAIGFDGNIYSGTEFSGMFISSNNGNTWTSINSGLTASHVMWYSFDLNSNMLISTWGGGIFLSNNHGLNWTPINTGLTTNNISPILCDSKGNVFAGTDVGVFRSVAKTDTTLSAQITWKQPYSANVGNVKSLTINKNGYLLAGTWGNGAYRSHDNGNTWDSSFIPDSDLWTLLSDSLGNIFAGTWGQGIYKSTDNGNTWNSTNNGLSSPYIRSLAISPSGCLFAGANDGTVCRSTDSGQSWNLIFSNYTNDYIRHIAINSTEQIFISTADRGIYRSDDNGINWMPINSGLGTSSISFVAIAPDGNIYSGTEFSGIFISNNNGNTWTAINNGLTASHVMWYDFDLNGDMLISTWGGGIFLSNNQGLNWTPINTGLTTNNISPILCDSKGDVFAGTDIGIFRSIIAKSDTVPSEKWKLKLSLSNNNGFSNLLSIGGSPTATVGFDQHQDVLSPPVPPTYYAYLQIDTYPFYLTTDIKDWTSPFSKTLDWYLKIVNADNKTTTLKWNPNDLPNVGRFNIIGQDTINMKTDSVFTFTGNKELVVEYSSLSIVTYDFTKAGWYLVSLPVIPMDSSVASIFPTAVNGIAYEWDAASNNYNEVTFINPQKGYWLEIASPSSDTITGIAFSGFKEHFASMGWYLVGSLLGVTDFSNPLDNPDSTVLSPAFAWDPITESYTTASELKEKQGYWLAVFDACDLTIGTTNNESTTNIQLASKEDFINVCGSTPPPCPAKWTGANGKQHVLNHFELFQNYPNPFNPETTIQYQTPEKGHVSLLVYNTAGQVVRKLVDSDQNPGSYQLKWDGKDDSGLNQGSGVYILKIKSKNFSSTRKLLLIK